MIIRVMNHTVNGGLNSHVWAFKSNGQEGKRAVIHATRKTREARRPNDFYETPYIVTRALVNQNIFPKGSIIYDPCCGKMAIGKILKENGHTVIEDDITTNGKDFLQCNEQYDYLVMNPPFKLFYDFILKAQETTNKVFASIVPINFFPVCKKQYKGVWKHLKQFFHFYQNIDYRGSPDSFSIGIMATAWGIWDMDYNGNTFETSILDLEKYRGLKNNGTKQKVVIDKWTALEKWGYIKKE
ncbi:hypothetical protein AGMMS50255_2720 [Spirochaetia bacterium]|nr:hypothetical protein AGMMS50255_2720 [Spirochaetia bacterium]